MASRLAAQGNVLGDSFSLFIPRTLCLPFKRARNRSQTCLQQACKKYIQKSAKCFGFFFFQWLNFDFTSGAEKGWLAPLRKSMLPSVLLITAKGTGNGQEFQMLVRGR